MDDGELDALLRDHYRGEAQTLTTGAEENLLKLAELLGSLSKEEKARWQDIRDEYVRRKKLGGDDADGSHKIANTLLDISRAVDELRTRSTTPEILQQGLATLAGIVGKIKPKIDIQPHIDVQPSDINIQPQIAIAAPDTQQFSDSLNEMKILYNEALLPLARANYLKMRMDHSIWQDLKQMNSVLAKLETLFPEEKVVPKAKSTRGKPAG
ncbi:MAG: hypothetical protein LBQ81_00165, partial [Zoogloeaceae bacterium]|jgi:hypothetical protein|nr:hypothetical protein [Zoogloeaceae bacterium]